LRSDCGGRELAVSVMSKTKLLVVEGVPGAGKTTTATFIKEHLDSLGVPARLYQEGDLDHPADFESVARLDRAEYATLLAAYPAQAGLLARHVQIATDDHFFPYRKLQIEHGAALPDDLYAELARHEIHDLPASEYCRLTAGRWSEFAAVAEADDAVTVFECCLIQNPLTVLLARHDASADFAGAHVRRLAGTVRALNPAVIYLYQRDLHATLARAAAERPPEWLDYVVGYLTGQAYGQARGLAGFDGMVQFYEDRRAVELPLLFRLPAQTLVLDVSDFDWRRCRREVKAFVERMVGA
jgi:hypothetical protein